MDDSTREVKRAASVIEKYLGRHADAIARTAARETGSPVSYQHHDIEGALAFLRNIGTLKTLLPTAYRFEPKGRVLIVLSANEPIITATILAFSGLFMGNEMHMKPSSKSPSYARLLAREISKIPTMRGRVRSVSADPEEIARLIHTHAFDFVLSFGSRSTNNKLAVMCAEAEVEFLPESEGNDWAYLDKDLGGLALGEMSDLIVESFTRHNGQMCNALRGVLIHASAYDGLVAQMKEDFSRIAVGSPLDPKVQIGTLICGTEARASAIAQGAASKAGDAWTLPAPVGAFAPMIVIEPDDASAIFSESIFAPVLWIRKVRNHAEAIEWYEKKNAHGLGFSVFSKNKKVVSECTERIMAGRININKHPLDVGLFDPLGGVRLSGHGGPSLWIEELSNRKLVNG